MDVVTILRHDVHEAPGPAPALPPEAPLVMPIQSLRARPHVAKPRFPLLFWRRLVVLGGAAAMTVVAAHEMYLVLDVGGLTTLEALVLGLFVALFAWIALSLTNAVAGLVATLVDHPRFDPTAAAESLKQDNVRFALLMPTYNEEPTRVFSGLQATYESIVATGALDKFDFFVLSDTTSADIWIAEEAAFMDLRARIGGETRLFYRRRPKNTDRKAGNIAEWVQRFGGRYEGMLILDADSLLTGDCAIELAWRLHADARMGIVQSLPVIVGARTLFARMQQFAGRLYGPMIARGLAWWHGADSNYWGHNAMIRTRAFAASAGLPHLRGPSPIGGHILSHDFVEAALMRRNGWAVCLVPTIAGSYEEGPPSLVDLAIRDRRWCQGNLQHTGVLPARGLHPISRLHLLTGIGTYITAPMWLLMILLGLLSALQARFVPPDYFPSGLSLYPAWPAQDPVRAVRVFVATMAILLLPKVFAYILLLFDGSARRGFGGGVRALTSMLVETLLSGLMAAIMMVTQSAAVFGILTGRDSGWKPQRRGDGTLSLADGLRFLPHTLLGVVLAAAALAISLPLFFWMLPVVAGLLLSIPLALWTARDSAQSWLTRSGILRTPEETDPPEILQRYAALSSAASSGVDEAVRTLWESPILLEQHRAMLPLGGARQAGDYAVHRLIARAKIEDASGLEGALLLLTTPEKAAALGDTQALNRLLELAHQAKPQPPKPSL